MSNFLTFNKVEKMKMKTITIFGMVLWALVAQAQTNITFETLTVGNRTFTNCTVRRLNAADAIVTFADGGTRVAISNLPPDLQKQFGYDPAAAEAERAAQEARIQQQKLAAAQAAEARRAREAELRANAQVITVESIGDPLVGKYKCEIDPGGIVLLADIPENVRSVVLQKQQLRAEIDRLKNMRITVTATDASGDAVASQISADTALQNAKDERDERIANAKEKLRDLEKKSAECRAYYTGQDYGGYPTWQCVAQ
jgi:hypothetical protein